MVEFFLVWYGQVLFGIDDYDWFFVVGDQQGVWFGEYFVWQGLMFDCVICGMMNCYVQMVVVILCGMDCEGVVVDCYFGLNEYDFYGLFVVVVSDYLEIVWFVVGLMKEYFCVFWQVLQLWIEDKFGDVVFEIWVYFQQCVVDVCVVICYGGGQCVLVVSFGGLIVVIVQQVFVVLLFSVIVLNLQICNSSFLQFFFNVEVFYFVLFNGILYLEDFE